LGYLGWDSKIIRAAIVCNLELNPTYSNGTLSLQFTVGTKQPLTWNTWLVAHTGIARLWSVALGVVNPPANVNIPLASFPALGNVGVLSTLSNSAEGVLCGGWKTAYTGGTGASIDDLRRRVLESGVVKALP
jgi:hypothetical protein